MQHINLRIIKLRRFHQHIYTFAQTLTVNLAIILSSKFDYPTTVFLPKNPALPVIRFHACEEGGDYLKFNVQRITSCLLLQPVQQQVLRSVHGRVSKIHKKDRSCGRTQQMRDRRRARRRYLRAFRDE